MSKPILRTCTSCKAQFEADLRHFHANGKGGYRGECVNCWRFKNAAFHANNRAKLLGQSERLTVEDIRAAYLAANGLDYWTGQKLGVRWVVDHIIPLSRGGLNTPKNIAITTAKTNQKKASKVLQAWLSELAAMGYRHELQEGLELPIQQRLGI